jgi:tetratricopeptide (TPR) repeat protein
MSAELFDVDDVVKRAEALMEIDRDREAAALLRQALASHPEDPQLLDTLGTALLDVDDRQALEVAERLIRVDPEGHRGHVIAATACDSLGRKDEAEAHARRSIEAAPWLWVPHAVLAEVLSGRRGRRDEANDAIRHALELQPENATLYLVRGNIDLAYGDWARAKMWYEKALQIDPTLTAAQRALVVAHDGQDMLNAAVVSADQLLRLDPQDTQARRVLTEVVYTTLMHVQWVLLALALLAYLFRKAY